MKLVVKPKNIVGLNKIKADAFIFGLKDFSVNQTAVIDINSLTILKEKIKTKEIFIAIDKNIFDKDIDKLKEILQELESLKISGILFYDIALLRLKAELELKTPFIWNQNYFVTNYKTLKFYQDLGVKGAVISSEITLEEIKEITSKVKDLSLFVNGFGYQMMAFSKRKLISNYFKYTNKKDFKRKHYIVNKDGKFRIIEDAEGTAFLSNYVLNCIKEMNNFKSMGISYLILDEKELKKKEFLYVLDMFHKANTKKLSTKELEQMDGKISKLFETSTGFLYKKTIYKLEKKVR